jgi:hemoglobin
MKKDIENRADIELFVNRFYVKINQDKEMAYIFNDIAKVNWEKHLLLMCDFWENGLFYTGVYEGSPMELHMHLQKLTVLTIEHFNQWNKLFNETIDKYFDGANAELAKQRAAGISAVMQEKLFPPVQLLKNAPNQ